MYRNRFNAREICVNRRVRRQDKAFERADAGKRAISSPQWERANIGRNVRGFTENQAAILARLGASRITASEKNAAEWQRDASYP